MAKVLRPRLLFLLALVLAWLFDYFFWGKNVGVSFPLFIVLLIATGMWLAGQAKLRPAPAALWLLVPIVALSLVSVLRADPFTLLTSWLSALILLCVFALSFLGGRWPHYGFADYIVNLLTFIPRGLGLLRQQGKKAGRVQGEQSFLRSMAPVARGLLLALPLLWFLTLLLSSADPFFAEWMDSLFFNLENAPEYMLRGLIILGLAYVFSATYLYAFNHSKDEALLGEKKPLLAPLLGFPEAATMLASVNLLLASFVVAQFRYFFGGLSNILEGPGGFTFAEYARRGFAELVIVALTVLVFFILLSSISKRKSGRQQNWFSGLGVGLFLWVTVILVSAFERLLLLEEAYGFTRFRTYPHIFMIWLGILLLAVVILETLQRQRAFALAVLLAALGFALSLPLLNVDAFIARTNVERASSGGDLDHLYLASLSDDAVPVLVSAFQAATERGDALLANQLTVALACHFAGFPPNPTPSWQAWSWAKALAQDQWRLFTASLDVPIVAASQGASQPWPSVAINGQFVDCAVPAFEADFP